MFLARKISLAKWTPGQGFAQGEISADALTGDLRTRDNSLSFWRCDDEGEHDVEEVALAIATPGDRLDKIDIVWLDEADLRNDGQTLRNSPGATPITELANRHVDVCRLDCVRLGDIARRVAVSIQAKRFRRLAKRRVRDLVTTAVKQGRIHPDALANRIREEIAR